MKTKVVVTLRGTLRVPLEVEHDNGEDPTDLTAAERRQALSEAFMNGDAVWHIESVEEA